MTFSRNVQTARCALELTDLIRAAGYDLSAVQTTPGPFEGRFSIVQNDDALIVGIECNRGVRFIGRRNMRTTCFSTCITGRGWWKTQPAEFPHLVGYHNAEASSNFMLEPTADAPVVRLGAVLLNRQEVKQRAQADFPRASDLLSCSNHCTPDLFRHTQFAAEVNHRFNGGDPQADLLEMALGMLETAERTMLISPASDAELRLIDTLAAITRRIQTGAKVTRATMEAELQIGSTHLNTLMQQTVGMTPGRWITKIKTETVLQLLLDPIKRRSAGLGDQISDAAAYVHWKERAARTNVEKLTGALPNQVLVR